MRRHQAPQIAPAACKPSKPCGETKMQARFVLIGGHLRAPPSLHFASASFSLYVCESLLVRRRIRCSRNSFVFLPLFSQKFHSFSLGRSRKPREEFLNCCCRRVLFCNRVVRGACKFFPACEKTEFSSSANARQRSSVHSSAHSSALHVSSEPSSKHALPPAVDFSLMRLRRVCFFGEWHSLSEFSFVPEGSCVTLLFSANVV